MKSLHVSGSLRNTKRPWYLQRRLQAAHSVPSLRGSSHVLFANHVHPNVSSTLHVLVGFALFSASQVGAAELDKNTVTKSCPSLCDPMGCSTHARLPCFSLTQSWLKLMSIEPVMPSNYFILCRPLLLLPSIFPSIRDSTDN